METKTDFIIVGASIIDVLVRPVNAQVFETGSFPVDQIIMRTGGDAVNEAAVLTSLNSSVRLISKIGEDFAGSYILEYCRKHHIDSSFIVCDPDIDTGVNIVLVDASGERSFLTSSSGSLRKLTLDDISDEGLRNGRFLCFASIFVSPHFDDAALSALFRRAKEHGMIICADMTKRKNQEQLFEWRRSFSYIDYIFPNYEEASLLTGLTDWDEIADAFLSCGVKHVIIKAGSQGCFIKTLTDRYWISAYPKARCVDTTGAGDTFTACFLYALNSGKSLKECGKFANAGASLCIEQAGASGALANIADIERRSEFCQLRT